MNNSISIYIDDEDLYNLANWDLLSPIKYNFVSNRYANILCVGLSRLIDDNYISHFPNISHIISPTTAIDHISVSNKKIQIINLIPDQITDITASSEFTLLLIMSIIRRSQISFTGKIPLEAEDISGMTVGILGYGRIGKNIDRYLTAMGATVIWHDIASGCSKQEILSRSDIIVVCVSSKEENKKFVSSDDFSAMEKKPYFINISRGFIIDEIAMLKSLKNDKLRGVAVDVVEDANRYKEYMSKYNLIITPHCAGTTVGSRAKACSFVLKKLKNIFLEREIDERI